MGARLDLQTGYSSSPTSVLYKRHVISILRKFNHRYHIVSTAVHVQIFPGALSNALSRSPAPPQDPLEHGTLHSVVMSHQFPLV